MTVSELKEMLNKYPDDMEIVVDRWSDYVVVDDIEVIKGVPNEDWVMRSHSTMSAENKAKEKEYLYI